VKQGMSAVQPLADAAVSSLSVPASWEDAALPSEWSDLPPNASIVLRRLSASAAGRASIWKVLREAVSACRSANSGGGAAAASGAAGEDVVAADETESAWRALCITSLLLRPSSSASPSSEAVEFLRTLAATAAYAFSQRPFERRSAIGR
jgi:hypothetical protein